MAALNPLVIGPEEREKIARLKGLAESTAVPHAVMLRIATAPPTRELLERNDSQTIKLPAFYQVTYTHEEHAPGVMCRHISVSVKDDKCAPAIEAVNMLLGAFGFANRVPETIFYLEPLDRDRTAINVIEPLDGNLERLKK